MKVRWSKGLFVDCTPSWWEAHEICQGCTRLLATGAPPGTQNSEYRGVQVVTADGIDRAKALQVVLERGVIASPRDHIKRTMLLIT